MGGGGEAAVDDSAGPHHLRSGRDSRHCGGHLAVGSPADLCIFDPEALWKVSPEALVSCGKNTPFMGCGMQGRAAMTLVGGRIVFGG